MGAKACKKSKVREPKRDEAKELAEKEKAERESQAKAEAEAEALRAAQAEADRLASEKEEEAELARLKAEETKALRLEEEKKRKEQQAAEEARKKAEQEQAEREQAEREQAEREQAEREQAKARMRNEEEETAATRKKEENPIPATVSDPKQGVPESVPIAQSSQGEKHVEIKDDGASEETMSTATGAKHKILHEKMQEISQGATPKTSRSIGNCDMTPVDKTAKNVSKMCGCDLGDDHDENSCPICKNMDLSDAPILN